MKVGDRVRVLVGQEGCYKAGDVGVLESIFNDRAVLVRFDEGQGVFDDRRWYTRLEHLEPEFSDEWPACLGQAQWKGFGQGALILAPDGTTICQISVLENSWVGSAHEVADEIVRRLRND